MEELQAQTFDGPGRVNHGRRFTLLGDGIFRPLDDGNSCIKSYHFPVPAIPLEEWQVRENHMLRSIRQHIEHSYGAMANTFSLCASKQHFKLKGRHSIANELVNLSFFLFNCYTAVNGNSTSVRFGCIPPTLEEYLFNDRLHL